MNNPQMNTDSGIVVPPIALSIQQPWAWLIVQGLKDVENRTWPSSFRGRVAIHAGKRIDERGGQLLREEGIELPESFETGGIVGVATVTDCVGDYVSRWFFGPFGFVMKDAAPVPFVPCRGQLGFFRWGNGGLHPTDAEGKAA